MRSFYISRSHRHQVPLEIIPRRDQGDPKHDYSHCTWQSEQERNTGESLPCVQMQIQWRLTNPKNKVSLRSASNAKNTGTCSITACLPYCMRCGEQHNIQQCLRPTKIEMAKNSIERLLSQQKMGTTSM